MRQECKHVCRFCPGRLSCAQRTLFTDFFLLDAFSLLTFRVCVCVCVFSVHCIIVEPRRRPGGAAADQRERFSVQAGLEGKPSLPPGQSRALL